TETLTVAPLAVNAGSKASINAGTPFTFSSSVTGGAAPYSYFWNFGDGITTTGSATPSHTYNENGTYTALLSVTDAAGKTMTSTTTITVANIAPAVTVSGPPAGNVGSAVTFIALATHS